MTKFWFSVGESGPTHTVVAISRSATGNHASEKEAATAKGASARERVREKKMRDESIRTERGKGRRAVESDGLEARRRGGRSLDVMGSIRRGEKSATEKDKLETQVILW